jgi:hypothetical protein
LLNENGMRGSLASATVSFSGGEDGPSLDETLDAAKSSSVAGGSIDDYRRAVKRCDAVTYSVPGVGTSTVHVGAISFADLGDDSFAARFSATSGALDGFEVIEVGVQTEDVVLDLSFYFTDPGDAEDATSAALGKVEDELGTSSTNG